MNKITIGLILCFFTATGFAQVKQSKKKKVSLRKQSKLIAKAQISQLKEGALLVRLITKNNTITALKKIGKDELAYGVEKTQSEYNRSIIAAFKTNFDFCPTYFFFSDNSTKIREKEFNKIVFLNEELVVDTTIKFDNKPFLTADFATIEQDTAKYFSHYTYEQDVNGSTKRISNYYGGPDMGFGALIIRSDKFIQLRRPFPYYVKTYGKPPKGRNPYLVVKKMNKKLHNYYKKKFK